MHYVDQTVAFVTRTIQAETALDFLPVITGITAVTLIYLIFSSCRR